MRKSNHSPRATTPIPQNLFIFKVVPNPFLGMKELTSLYNSDPCAWATGRFAWSLETNRYEGKTAASSCARPPASLNKPTQFGVAELALSVSGIFSNGMQQLCGRRGGPSGGPFCHFEQKRMTKCQVYQKSVCLGCFFVSGPDMV